MSKCKEQQVTQEASFGVNHVLEFHLADHCNLSCKYCAHYAPVAEPRYATMDEVAEAMRVVRLIKPRLIKILGGEPLLHPDIDRILNYIGERVPQGTRALLTTNGILLKSMSDEFWELIKEHGITIYVSIYPNKADYQGMISLADSKGVMLAGLEYPVLSFNKVILAEDKPYDPKYAYSSCRAKCMQVRDGRLYPCSYSAYVGFVNRHFGTDFIHEVGDFINTDEIIDGRMVAQWMEEPKPFCAYCNYGNETRPRWESIGKHDVHEWVER